MNNSLLPIHFAPFQGYTNAAYRLTHARILDGIDTHYPPFVRVEHGEIRRKGTRDISSKNNREGIHLIPQLIASQPDKLEQIITLFIKDSYQEADINLGCLFLMLTKRHNGAGMLPYPDEVEDLLTAAIEKYPQIHFSVKLRLGWEDAEECLALLPLPSTLPLTHIILHPRLGKQQYKGEVNLSGFEAFYNGCEKPLLYNGDLRTVGGIQTIAEYSPKLVGVVIGRGLLANPTLAQEYRQRKKLSPDEIIEKVRQLHAEVYNTYEELLQGGETQLLVKMKSFWEYPMPDEDRKAKKTIHKTSKLVNYRITINNLLSSYKRNRGYNPKNTGFLT